MCEDKWLEDFVVVWLLELLARLGVVGWVEVRVEVLILALE